MKKSVKKIEYLLTDEALESITHNIVGENEPVNKKLKELENTTLVVVQDNQLKFYSTLKLNNQIFTCDLPQPTSLFLFQAEHFTESTLKIQKQFYNYTDFNLSLTEERNGEIKVINDEFFNLFIIYKISAITSFIMTVECHLNHLIPLNYKFEISEGKKVDKDYIERTFSIKDKFRLLQEILPQNSFLKKNSEIDKILNLNNLRNDFIHLKTEKDKKNMSNYINNYQKIINLDLRKNLKIIQSFVKNRG